METQDNPFAAKFFWIVCRTVSTVYPYCWICSLPTDWEDEVFCFPGTDDCGIVAMNSVTEGPFYGAGNETRDYIRALIKKYELREKWEETRQ